MKIALSLLVAVFVLSGCTFLATGVDVPKDLKSCDPKYMTDDPATKMDCSKMSETRVCSYYLQTEGWSRTKENLEFLNECYACQYYGADSVKEIGKRKQEHLGFEVKECTQGKYAD